MSVEIRPATVVDAEALEPLFTTLGHPASAAVLRQRWAGLPREQPADQVLVAVLEGTVVGLVTTHATPVLHRPTPVGRITTLVVLPAMQGRGIGARLLAAGEAVLWQAGVDRIEVTSGRQRTAAHRFYERQGYEADALRFAKSRAPGPS